jgi:carbamoyltransferase
MLLNTSFNENEPIVLKPEEALDCFLRTHMDVLVMGSHTLERVTTSATQPAADLNVHATSEVTR